MIDSTFINNTIPGDKIEGWGGGAISNVAGYLTVTNCTLNNNSVIGFNYIGGSGGAIESSMAL